MDLDEEVHVSYLYSIEQVAPCDDYLHPCSAVTVQMRRALLEWMAEVCRYLKFSCDTLHLAVTLVDRFCAARCRERAALTKKNLQLYGTACMVLAMKANETVYSVSDDFIALCHGAFNKSELGQAEWAVGEALQWRLQQTALASEFLRIQMLKHAHEFSTKERERARGVVDKSFLDPRICGQFLPSRIARAAIHLTLGAKDTTNDPLLLDRCVRALERI